MEGFPEVWKSFERYVRGFKKCGRVFRSLGGFWEELDRFGRVLRGI